MRVLDSRGNAQFLAGMRGQPRHHVFPQEHAKWFRDRGIDIDKYTVELDTGVHEAIDRLGYNDDVFRRLQVREEALGRPMTEQEAVDFVVKSVLPQYGIEGVPFVRYWAAR